MNKKGRAAIFAAKILVERQDRHQIAVSPASLSEARKLLEAEEEQAEKELGIGQE